MWRGRRGDGGLRWQVEGFSLIAAKRKQVPHRRTAKGRGWVRDDDREQILTVERWLASKSAGVRLRDVGKSGVEGAALGRIEHLTSMSEKD